MIFYINILMDIVMSLGKLILTSKFMTSCINYYQGFNGHCDEMKMEFVNSNSNK